MIQDEVVNTVDVPPTHLKEPVDFVREAQEKWEDKLKQAINKLCTDYKVVLSQLVGVHAWRGLYYYLIVISH